MTAPHSRKLTSAADVGHLVQTRRKGLKMSQDVLASLSGIAQPNISNIERGQGAATLETYLRLFAALGVDLYGEPRT